MLVNTRLALGLMAVAGVGALLNPGAEFVQTQWVALSGAPNPQAVWLTVESETPAGLELRLDIPGVMLTRLMADDGNLYTQASIPGCGATAERIGCPALPFKGFFVEIPYGVDVRVEAQAAAWVSLGMGFRVYPLQPPQPESGPAVAEPFQIDQEAYALDCFLPVAVARCEEPGFIRGRRVVFVKVFPLQYNPLTTELRACSTLRAVVHFEGVIDPSGEIEKQRVASTSFESLAEALIVNYKPIAPWSVQCGVNGPRAIGADYLVIVGNNLYEEVLPLAAWKHKKGFITKVAKMSEVGSTSAHVKSYIQNAYNTWTPAPSFVLLVGDAADVPPSTYTGSVSCTSDHPYACVNGSDYFADLTLSRLPVHTETECTNVVGKVLTYDRTPDGGNWYGKFLAAAYFQDSNNNSVADRWFMETAMTVYDFLVIEQGWGGYTALCTTYWPLNYTVYHFRADSYPHREAINLVRWGVAPYPDPVPQWIINAWTSNSQAGANISAAINAGVGIVQHRDHGLETGWDEPPFTNTQVNSLSNGVKTPVVFSMNCLTGSFHITSGDCFCEAFLKKTPGGCVGIVGATRVSYSGYNDLITHGLYTCFWPIYDPTHTNTTYPYSWRPAQALNYAKYYMYLYEGSGDYTAGEVHMFHYFGDPEMNLRTAAPQQVSASHPATVLAGKPVTLAVTASMGAAPLANALVTISHPSGSDYFRAWTGPDGVATFAGITFADLGAHDVVVTTRNGVPYEGTITAALTTPGDLNCDGTVDFADINPFVLLLSDPDDWQATYPGCPPLNGDCNGDGQVNFADINPFVGLLGVSE